MDLQLAYVGMAGRRADQKGGLRQRLRQHASGRRSGDQFCVYVCDRFVVPTLTPEEQGQIGQGELSLDNCTRDFILKNLRFRFIEVENGDEARKLEDKIKAGALGGHKPLLNPS